MVRLSVTRAGCGMVAGGGATGGFGCVGVAAGVAVVLSGEDFAYSPPGVWVHQRADYSKEETDRYSTH